MNFLDFILQFLGIQVPANQILLRILFNVFFQKRTTLLVEQSLLYLTLTENTKLHLSLSMK